MNYSNYIVLIAGISVIIEWLYYMKRKDNRKERSKINKRQQIFVVIAFILSLFLCYLLKGLDPTAVKTVDMVGLLFITHGTLIRGWTYHLIKANRREGSLSSQGFPLLSHGPYRFHRHPFHVGIFLTVVGCGFIISHHWLAFPLIFILLGSALHPVMKEEELQLQIKYGEIYPYWCKRRFRLLPFVY
ncbi:methyltransferase family protein [Salipaludibacillus keqinensis]|nr:methyltransferase [Salipaludibacillus keqinensis]